MLAHKNIKGRRRVGNYGVNIDDIDHIAVPSMIPTQPGEIVVIDEIGKMECMSPLFTKTLLEILNSQHRVIGSIGQKGTRFMQEIKQRDNIVLIRISEETRNPEVAIPLFLEICPELFANDF